MTRATPRKIAVVGAGIAGLAAAYELQKRGHEVEIFEASDHVGGRAQLLQRPGTDDWADVGSQYFHSNYTRAYKLIEELGLTGELKKISGKTRFFESTTESFTVTTKMPWMKPAGIFGNFAALMYVLKLVLSRKLDAYSYSPQPKWDNQTALDSTSNEAVKNYIVRTLILTGALSEPDFSNVSVLQVVRLIRIILMTDNVSLKSGTATFHQALARKLTIHKGTPIKRVTQDKETGQINGIETEAGRTVQADHVVLATPGPITAKLVPESWEAEKSYLDGIDMPPAILVSLFLDRALEPGVWTYFLPMEEQHNVRLCVDTHQKNPGNTPSGKATLQAWILNPQSAPLIGLTDEEIYDAAMADVAKFFPEMPNWVEGYAITRHAMAVPQSSVGHNQATAKFLKSIDGRDNISFCGDYLTGGYMECALWSVEHALQKFDA